MNSPREEAFRDMLEAGLDLSVFELDSIVVIEERVLHIQCGGCVLHFYQRIVTNAITL